MTALVLCLAISSLFSQLSFKDFVREHYPESISFRERQSAFRKWFSKEKMLNTKGYKQFNRVAYYYESRWAGNHNPVKPGLIYEKMAKQKKERVQFRGNEINWIPVGPNRIEPSPQPWEVRGVGRLNVVTFHPTDTNILYVGAANGGIWKSENAGESWLPLGDNLPIMRISDIAIDPQHPDTLYACLGDINTTFVNVNNLYPTNFGEGVFKSVDGGNTWTPTGLSLSQGLAQFSLMRRVLIHPEQTNLLIAAGISGIWKSEDGGDNWDRVVDDQIFLDIDMDPNNPTVLYASSTAFSSTIFKSTDFGTSWEALDVGIPQDGSVIRIEIAIAPSNSNYLYATAVGTNGGLHSFYRSTNAGANWELMATQETGPNFLAAINGDPNLLDSEAGGQGEYDLTLMVDPFNENIVYSGGINVWKSENGGAVWNIVSFAQQWFGPTIHQDIHQITYNQLDGKYYVCNDGGLDRTDTLIAGDINFALFNCLDFNTLEPLPDCYELPTQWERLSDGLAITEFYRLGINPHRNASFLAGSQDNSVFYQTGGRWVNIFDGDGMECIVDPNDPNTFYAGMELGRLELSYDGGITVIDEATASIYDDPTQFPGWLTPLLVHPTQINCLYVGFSDVWKSTDRGQSWSKISDLPTIAPGEPGLPIRALKIAPSNPNIMYLSRQPFFLDEGIIPGEFWKSIDGGTNWAKTGLSLPQDIVLNAITISDTDPNTLWVSCSHFQEGVKVFKSIDGGDTWENISRNLPNLPINTIIHQARSLHNTIYVGTDRGVFYTDDQLQTWEPLSAHLPNVIVQELEIDYDRNELYAATFGRGIWKTDLIGVTVNTQDIPRITATDWNIYPNPNSGQFSVQLKNLKTKGPLLLEVIDIMGRVIHDQRYDTSVGFNQYDLNLSLAKGIYYLRISQGSGSSAKSFVVD